jgi:hypothetical protein
MGEGELELCLPSPKDGRGAGGEGKDLKQDSDAPNLNNFTYHRMSIFVAKITTG